MRILLGLFALGPLALQFCGASNEPPPPPPSAGAPTVTDVAATAVIELPAASHGGTVLAVEDRPVEVVVATDGQVSAWLPGPPPPPNATLSVQVNTASGPKMTTLEWNAADAVFEGVVVGEAPAPGPIEVGLTIDGRLRRGHVRRMRVIRPRHPRARVDVRVRGPRPPQPRANVNIQVNGAVPRPPRADVRVQINGPRPPPPPHVRIDVRGPRPPTPGVNIRIGGGMHHGMRHGMDHGRMEGHRRGRGHRRGHDDDDD